MPRAMLVATLAFLSACATTPARVPISVAVQDAASHAPIAGAKVIADVPSRNHPLSIATMLGETGPLGSSATTGQDGRADVTYAAERPARIAVFAPGYPVLVRYIDEPWNAPFEFTGQACAPDARSLHIRIFPCRGRAGPVDQAGGVSASRTR